MMLASLPCRGKQMHHNRSSLDSSSERNNYFVLIRLVACLVILFLHSFTIRYGVEWTETGAGYVIHCFAQLALNVFFCASGYLITASMLSRRNAMQFVMARFARLAPALLLVSLAVTFIIGSLCTTLPLSEYFSSLQTWQYPVLTGLTMYDKFGLPGVFGNFADPYAVNVPIWTLKYELLCYAFTLAAFVFGLLEKRTIVMIATMVLAVFTADELWFGYANENTSITHFRAFLICYLAGTLFWLFREQMNRNWFVLPILIGAALTVSVPVVAQTVQAIAITYTMLMLAYANKGQKRKIYLNDDYTYGIYIMHWPVFGTLLTFWPDIPQVVLLVCGLVIVVPLAMLSWHFVEKPTLKVVSRHGASKNPQKLKLA